MPNILSDQQIGRYREDGFVHPVRVFDAGQALAYRRRFEAYERANGGWYELSKGQKLYLLQTWMAELASHPRLLDAVEGVLGPDLLVWGASLFVKEAGDDAFVSWHQDSTYWGLSMPDVVTAWIALSPATRRSGCMKMLPGSHAFDQLPHRDTFDKKNLLTRGQELSVKVEESQAAFVELAPGEISLHHIRTVHGSEPNRSDDRRIGVAIRYIAPHVRQIYAEGDSAWLVRGQDRHGHFVPETPPKGDMDAAAVAEHARIMALRQNVLFKDARKKPARA
jgi:ectoine hydroxylase-related dioxygenase (phytanoyl-CoA dioxygenase family)